MCEAPEACGCLVSREGMQGPWWGRGSEQRMASGYRRRGALRGEPEGGTKGGAQVRGRVLTRESVLAIKDAPVMQEARCGRSKFQAGYLPALTLGRRVSPL